MKEISDEITVRKRKRKARLTYVFYKLLWVIPLDHKKLCLLHLRVTVDFAVIRDI